MVNLELYRVFYAVAKCGSLTKAAQELFISQPAVSQAIKQLESQLGIALFTRTHRGMELSAAGGKQIFKQVEEALLLLDDAEKRLAELKTTAEGTIRIGATDSIFYHLLADQIAQFSQRYPAVKLELISSTSPYTVSLLKEGKCDVAFINLPLSDPEVEFCGTVTTLTEVFVAGERFAGLKGQKIPLSRLQELPILMIEENTISRRALAAFFNSQGVRLDPDTEVSNWDFMIKLVVKGMGVGCIPREYCVKELESGELFCLDVDPAIPSRGVGLIVAQRQPMSFALREFMSMFVKKVNV